MTSQEETSIPTENNGIQANQVFAIPELLEAILLCLSPEAILTSQRVSKSWKTAIDESKRVRQALFIEPKPAKDAWIARVNPPAELLAEEPSSFKIGKYSVIQVPAESLSQYLDLETETSDSDARISIKVELNTMLHQRGHWKQMTLDDRIERGEGLRLGRTKKKILGYGREMFLTQPPCKEVFLWVNWGQPTRIFNEDGVRFGQVLEITENQGEIAYLPHMFMMAKGCIALTEAEEKMVEESMAEQKVDLGTAVQEPTYRWVVGQPYTIPEPVTHRIRRWFRRRPYEIVYQ